MAVSIVIGGQYGSEGKGKAAYYWAKKMNAAAVVRVGGSNSGHTVYDGKGHQYAFRMLPTASILDRVALVLPAGSYLDIPVLLKEIESSGIPKERLKIDPNAVIITKEDKESEAAIGLGKEIGSTMSGTGAAVMNRVKRNKSKPLLMAKDIEELAPYLEDTKTFLRKLIDCKKHIVIEGTQGYGLSNYHTKVYPYATSRDTTAAGFLAETGLSPFDVKHIVMVIRAFPIRVAGDSGPLKDEIDWEIVSKEAGAQAYFEEKTTVTHKVRRVARFDPEIVREAVMVNRPDVVVLNHVDYLDFSNKNKDKLSGLQQEFVKKVMQETGIRIDYCGNGEMSLIPWEENEE